MTELDPGSFAFSRTSRSCVEILCRANSQSIYVVYGFSWRVDASIAKIVTLVFFGTPFKVRTSLKSSHWLRGT